MASVLGVYSLELLTPGVGRGALVSYEEACMGELESASFHFSLVTLQLGLTATLDHSQLAELHLDS
jgi:hypothetical protein